jgi:hypothetical protein
MGIYNIGMKLMGSIPMDQDKTFQLNLVSGNWYQVLSSGRKSKMRYLGCYDFRNAKAIKVERTTEEGVPVVNYTVTHTILSDVRGEDEWAYCKARGLC